MEEEELTILYMLAVPDSGWRRPPGAGAEGPELARLPGGAVALRHPRRPDLELRFTAGEWRAFVLGSRDGEFDVPGPS